MKKYLCIVMAAMLVLWAASGAFAVVYGASGYENYGYSESTAWEINSAAVLIKVRDDVNAGKLNYECYFKLTKDIDLTGYQNWKPIGGVPDSEYRVLRTGADYYHFAGCFDGGGHTIKINISKVLNNTGYDTLHACGLFGTMDGGYIKNLNVSGTVEVYGRSDVMSVWAGGIVAFIREGVIENCKFDGTVRAKGEYYRGNYAGGIAAYVRYLGDTSIKNCKVGSLSDTSIISTNEAGGIIGWLDDGETTIVTGNYSRVRLTGESTGGIYGGRGNGSGIVANNTEVDPDEEPEPDPGTASVTITKTSLTSGTAGTAYSDTLTAQVTGGSYAVTWTASGLPSWLSLNSSTGSLTGTPTTAGSYTFTITASISGTTVTDSKSYTITIASASQPTYSLNITNTSPLASGTVGTAYSQTFTAEYMGMTVQASWTASGLPSWLSLNSSTGALTGTPTAAGSYTFTVTAQAGQYTSEPKQFTINVSAGTGTEMPIDFGSDPEFLDVHQPVLEGAIIARFFVNLNGNSGTGSYVDFKVLKDTTYNPVQDFDPDFMDPSKTSYAFKCILTSIQMADPITATFHYGNNQTVTQTWTLKEYLDKYYNNSASPQKLRNLLAAMKDYGHYAQIALEANNPWTLGVDHIAMDCANVYTDADLEEARQAVSSYAIVRNTGKSGIKNVGFTLHLDSDTVIDLLITPASDYTGNVAAYSRGVIGVTDTSANLAVKKDGYYLVQISGIPAHKLAYTNTVRVVTDRDSFDVKVSALSYADTVFTSSNPVLSTTDMKKAVTSLYRYYKATKEYRGD